MISPNVIKISYGYRNLSVITTAKLKFKVYNSFREKLENVYYLLDFYQQHRIIVFVNSRISRDLLLKNLRVRNYKFLLYHPNMVSSELTKLKKSFQEQVINIIICLSFKEEIMIGGTDIVINFDFPFNDSELLIKP